MAVDPRQPLAGLGLAADQGEQADEAFQLVQAIAMFEETHAARSGSSCSAQIASSSAQGSLTMNFSQSVE